MCRRWVFWPLSLLFALLSLHCDHNETLTPHTLISVPTAGLVAYYALNGDAKDAVGNTSVGSVFDAMPIVDRFTRASAAYLFDGVTSYITIPDTLALRPQPVSVSLWVRVEGFTSVKMGGDVGFQIILLKQNTRDTQFEGYSISLDEARQRFGAGIASASGQQAICYGADSSIVLGRWIHLVLTASDVRVRLYQNTVPVDSVRSGFFLDYGSKPLTIGRGGDPAYDGFFNGAIDDICIYNRVLTTPEINSLFTAAPY